MFKKLGLIVLLFGISSLNANNIPEKNVEKTGFIHKVKNSSAMVKFFGGIIPCIATFISMDALIKTYKDNAEWHHVLDIAYYIKWISVGIIFIFCNSLMRVNFKKWLKDNQCDNKVISNRTDEYMKKDNMVY